MAVTEMKVTPTSTPQQNSWSKILKNIWVLYAISVIGFIILWDLAAVTQITGKFLPRPMEVLNQLLDMLVNPLAGKTLLTHLWFSLKRVLIAFVIAVAIGVPIGVAMGINKYVNALVKPVFDLFKPMPPIAWISLAILWFGINETSKVFIIVIGAIVPCIINSYNGIRLVDESLYDAIRMLGANKYQEIIEVTFPAAFPAIFAGIQISLSMAWTTVLAAELVGAREGMGFIIIMGMNLSKPAMIIGGMIVIALTAWLISVSVNYLERWVCPWKTDLNK
ncbi:ABC transporter permease [Desulforamulus ruminis]|uniref:Binding-protein-dependent transport systems inner membrane component n=1 Tax=Desulforamulus ruminis (strain ATCC 23193 / DSM 2154 / NCIMB 8452 / DL) TaxID=696281 RepID=F6DSQ2_DESRL|nr:ABC transporter permease [Desulforamulus ruminis]AEG58871.1 binding-protein-dependent transport systems inner membrane component [Desulforamulus ruminis DSM 2154]